MKEISVFEGNQLQDDPPQRKGPAARAALVGTSLQGAKANVPLDDLILSKHILYTGAIGTGKSNAIFQLVEQIQSSMGADDVMLIFDSKGDFYQNFHRKGDIVFSNDSKASGPDGSDYWNVFEELRLAHSLEEECYEIARSLFQERKQNTQQPFFPNAAADIFAGVLLHFARSGGKRSLNNAVLRDFFDGAGAAEIIAVLEKHPDLKAMQNYISHDDSGQTQGVLSELQQLVREIFVGNFRKPGAISMRNAVRSKGGKTLFVEYDLAFGNVLSPIYRVLLDMAIKEALGREKSEGNVWFIIDEFRLVPGLQHVDSGVNFGRSLGAKFVISVQNVDQVFHVYEEAPARSILSGFQTTISFRVSDPTTREFVKALFGKNRKREVYTATIASRGVIESVREANVVEDWDITNLPDGAAIIGLPTEEPFLFQFERFSGS